MTYVIGIAGEILPSHRLLNDLQLAIRGCRSLYDRPTFSSHEAVDMNLDRKEIIAGHPIKKVRDFLKNHFNDEVGVSRAQQLAAEYFGGDSDTILTALNKRGWFEEGKRVWKPALGQAVVHATYNRTKLGQ